MPRISLSEAQSRLPELIAGLAPGEQIEINEGGRAVALLVGNSPPAREPRVPGGFKGRLIIVEDDDEHLKDFRDFMP